MVNTDVRGRGYAPKGQTPVAYLVGGTRQKLSMISTVTNQGKTSWMIIDGNFNHLRLIEFFEALIQQAGRKVFLVLDNLGVHPSKPVRQWLSEHAQTIEVLPARLLAGTQSRRTAQWRLETRHRDACPFQNKR